MASNLKRFQCPACLFKYEIHRFLKKSTCPNCRTVIETKSNTIENDNNRGSIQDRLRRKYKAKPVKDLDAYYRRLDPPREKIIRAGTWKHRRFWEKFHAHQAAKRALQKNSLDYDKRYISQKTKDEVYNFDRGICQYCGSMINLEYDHIKPWSKGGSGDSNNIQLLCRKCNRKKSNKH